MRRTLIVTVLLAVLALIGPASAAQTADDGGEGKGPVASLVITKVVDGEGPTGGFVIDYECVGDVEGDGNASGSLTFDDAGPGAPETQTVDIFDSSTCTVTETDANGADATTYACTFESAPPNSPSAAADDTEGRDPGSCIDDQTVEFGSFGETGTITVTNTFEADVIPDDEEPPPAVDPGVVTATPSFTG
jgi:hypothetical protein